LKKLALVAIIGVFALTGCSTGGSNKTGGASATPTTTTATYSPTKVDVTEVSPQDSKEGVAKAYVDAFGKFDLDTASRLIMPSFFNNTAEMSR
jgi:ABC-type glycerol-3-phosphate transport system substrate-binding protein